MKWLQFDLTRGLYNYKCKVISGDFITGVPNPQATALYRALSYSEPGHRSDGRMDASLLVEATSKHVCACSVCTNSRYGSSLLVQNYTLSPPPLPPKPERLGNNIHLGTVTFSNWMRLLYKISQNSLSAAGSARIGSKVMSSTLQKRWAKGVPHLKY